MAEIKTTQTNVGEIKSQTSNTTSNLNTQGKSAADGAKSQAKGAADAAKAQAQAAADAAKAKAKEALDAAKAKVAGAIGQVAGTIDSLKGGLKKLKKPTPKTPPVKKFEPKKPPTPQKFEGKGSSVDYNKQEQQKSQPQQASPQKPTFPKGNPYRYTFKKSGGSWRITVDILGEPIGALSFQGNVTEEYAKQRIIESYKSSNPGIEGMTKNI